MTLTEEHIEKMSETFATRINSLFYHISCTPLVAAKASRNAFSLCPKDALVDDPET